VDDAPAEGNKSKEPELKHKRGKKGKKPHRNARARGGGGGGTGRGPRRRPGPQGPPSGPSRPRCVRRHAEDVVPIPQDPSQPHPRVVRHAQEVL
jgi:hypothetical protein